MKRYPHLSPTLYTLIPLTLLLLAGCKGKSSEDDEEEKPAGKAVVRVRMEELQVRDALVTVNALGKTEALRKEKIFSPIAGRIVALRVFDGSVVKKGEEVAVIESKESDAAIIGAEAMMKAATTPDAKSAAEERLRLARESRNSVSVTSGVDGVVAGRAVGEGELVAENGELLTIIDPASMVFIADVPVQELAAVRQGEKATVRLQSSDSAEHPAVVDAVYPQSDPQSQTVKTRLRLIGESAAGRPFLRTDFLGSAEILTGIRHHAFFVSRPSLLRNDENNTFSVVTFTPDSLALSIPVSVLSMTDSSVEVSGQGLRGGMPIIREGNYALPDSTRITLSWQE